MPIYKDATDNHDSRAKLDLRRYFLKKYHADTTPRVFDCCQGSGKLWAKLREEFKVQYWGMDVKPKAGRLAMDSTRYLAQSGWPEDVIDIDTYGSPWKHWESMLPNVARPVTVFLTLGAKGFNQGVDSACLRAMGIPFKFSEAMYGRLNKVAPRYCFGLASKFKTVITEGMEAISDGSARYFGIRLEPTWQEPDKYDILDPTKRPGASTPGQDTEP